MNATARDGISPDRLVGTWRLISATGTDAEGKEASPPYGPEPMGRVVLTPNGRLMAVLCDGRPELPEGEPRAYASYCGNFVVEDGYLVTTVDAALVSARIGSKQVRRIELHENRMTLFPPVRGDGVQLRLEWEYQGPA